MKVELLVKLESSAPTVNNLLNEVSAASALGIAKKLNKKPKDKTKAVIEDIIFLSILLCDENISNF